MRFPLNFTLTSIVGAFGNPRSQRLVSLKPHGGFGTAELTLEDCLSAAASSSAKIILIEGEEPLEYKHIGALVRELRARRKTVIVSTDGTQIRRFLHLIKPDKQFVWNVVFNGGELADSEKNPRLRTKLAMDGIQSAKRAGFLVSAQVVLAENTPVEDVASLFERLQKMHADRLFVSSAERGEKTLAEVQRSLGARGIWVFPVSRDGAGLAHVVRDVQKAAEAQLLSDGNS